MSKAEGKPRTQSCPKPSDPSPSSNGRDKTPRFEVNDRRFWNETTPPATGAPQKEKSGKESDPPREEDPQSSEIVKLKATIHEKEELLRKVADQVNTMKKESSALADRLRRDSERQLRQYKIQFLGELLEVLDNLKRSEVASKNASDLPPIVSGIEMVRKLFEQKLADVGVQEIAAQGKPFNPVYHEALTTQPTNERSLHDTVLDVVQPGFTFNDTLLRSAKVVVGKYTPPAEDPTANTSPNENEASTD